MSQARGESGFSMDLAVAEILRGAGPDPLLERHLADRWSLRAPGTLFWLRAAGLLAGLLQAAAILLIPLERKGPVPYGIVVTTALILTLVAPVAGLAPLLEAWVYVRRVGRMKEGRVVHDLWMAGWKLTDFSRSAVRLAEPAPWSDRLLLLPLAASVSLVPFLWMHSDARNIHYPRLHLIVALASVAIVALRLRGLRVLLSLLAAEALLRQVEAESMGRTLSRRIVRREALENALLLVPMGLPLLQFMGMSLLEPHDRSLAMAWWATMPFAAIPAALACLRPASPEGLVLRWWRHRGELNARFEAAMLRLQGEEIPLFRPVRRKSLDTLREDILAEIAGNPLREGALRLRGWSESTGLIGLAVGVIALLLASAMALLYVADRLLVPGISVAGVVVAIGCAVAAWCLAATGLTDRLGQMESLARLGRGQLLAELGRQGLRFPDITRCAVAMVARWPGAAWILALAPLPVLLAVPIGMWAAAGTQADRMHASWHVLLVLLCWGALMSRRDEYRMLLAFRTAEATLRHLERPGRAGRLPLSVASPATAAVLLIALPALHLAAMMMLSPVVAPPPLLAAANVVLLTLPGWLLLRPGISPVALRRRWEWHCGELTTRFETALAARGESNSRLAK